MIFLGMSTVNALRVNLSVAIVAMVNASKNDETHLTPIIENSYY